MSLFYDETLWMRNVGVRCLTWYSKYFEHIVWLWFVYQPISNDLAHISPIQKKSKSFCCVYIALFISLRHLVQNYKLQAISTQTFFQFRFQFSAVDREPPLRQHTLSGRLHRKQTPQDVNRELRVSPAATSRTPHSFFNLT